MSLSNSNRLPPPFSHDEEFARLLKEEGTFLGKGSSRRVYLISGDDYVLKVTSKHRSIPNWREIAAFLYFPDEPSIAKIVTWSDSGRCLVMERLHGIGKQSIGGFGWPQWITDRKHSNVGLDAADKLKICDYALIKVNSDSSNSQFE